MESIIISSKRKKFTTKSFFNYKKDELLENFKHEILNENLEKSYLLLFDLINSGFFKNIWTIYFHIYCEYIHILHPKLLDIIYTNFQRYETMRKNARKNNLNILNARNEFNFRKILFMILKYLVKTPKKHIGYFIPQSFNNQNKITSHTPLLNVFEGKQIPNLNILKEVINNQDYKDVEHAMKEFHHYLELAIHKKFIFDQENFETKNACFFWLAKILVIGAENTNIIGYPYNISLYHSIDPNSKDYFSPFVWNIVLNGSKKLGQQFLKHNIALYKIFNMNILQKSKRENFLVIQSILLFFEHIIWKKPNINLLNDDYQYIDSLYIEHQNTINNTNTNKSSSKLKPIKLKSSKIIEDSKDDIEKIIMQREKEIQNLLPKPPDFEIQEIKKSDKIISKKSKKKRKTQIDEDFELPHVFYDYNPPTQKDKDIIKKIQKHFHKLNSLQNIIVRPFSVTEERNKNNSYSNIYVKKLNNIN